MVTTRVLRHINASRERVYEALLDPDSVREWMVPQDMTSHIHLFEAREGGRFRISLTYDDPREAGKTRGATDTFEGQFTKLVPGREVVQVVEFESDTPGIGGEMTISYSLRKADGGGTNLTALHENVPPGVRPEDNELGWKMSIDKLAALVEDTTD